MMSDTEKSTSIRALLDDKLVPWIETKGMDCVVIARPALRDMFVPPGVQVSRKKLRGRRVSVKGTRPYGNTSATSARWPEDNQETTRVPSLTCIVAGHSDLRLGNYVLHCDEGYLVLIPPDVPHPNGRLPHLEGANLENGSCDILSITPRGQKVQCWLCHSRGPTHSGPGAGENIFLLDEQAAHLLTMVTEEALQWNGRQRNLCESLIKALLLMLQRELHAGRFLYLHNASPELAATEASLDPITHAQNYIKAHLNHPLTLEAMAHLVYMSRAQFAKRFLEQTGKTFIAYTNMCRIEQAQAFLQETNWAIPQIAKFIGFKSTSYFHRLFLREVGVSPMDYRRQFEGTASPANGPQKTGTKE